MSHEHNIDESYVVIGIVKGVRGLIGELRIDPMTDVPDRFIPGAKVLLGQKEYIISSSRYDKNKLLIKLSGIDTRNKAEILNGLTLYVESPSKIKLPPGNYFHYQLLGLKVFDENNCYLGTIQEILQTGANDVYVVKAKGIKDLLLPAISSVITSVDLSSGNMIVTVPQGL